jgi:hypothetical protein
MLTSLFSSHSFAILTWATVRSVGHLLLLSRRAHPSRRRRAEPSEPPSSQAPAALVEPSSCRCRAKLLPSPSIQHRAAMLCFYSNEQHRRRAFYSNKQQSSCILHKKNLNPFSTIRTQPTISNTVKQSSRTLHNNRQF